MNTRFSIFPLLPLLLCASVLLCCVRDTPESTTDRVRLRLDLLLTLEDAAGLLPVEVGDIRLYVFENTTGVLTDIIRLDEEALSTGIIDVSLSPGSYTFVAWADGGSDLTLGGYTSAQMNDATTHSCSTSVSPGVTTLAHFRLMLLCTPSSGASWQLTPLTESFDDLYYAITREVQVHPDTEDVRLSLNFVRHTSVLKVRFSGLEYLPAASVSLSSFSRPDSDRSPAVFVTAPHEGYTYEGFLDPYSRRVRFQAPYRIVSTSEIETDIKVHRLEIDTYTVRPVLLHIQDRSTGLDIVSPVDVIKTLLSTKDSEGNYLWQTQQQIDMEGEFEIDISLTQSLTGGIDVSISVEGYQAVDSGADVIVSKR